MPDNFINTQPQLEAAIGKEIKWETPMRNPHHTGTLLEAKGNNLLVAEDSERVWLWRPNLYNLRLAQKEESHE
jgi:hypothetical protein